MGLCRASSCPKLGSLPWGLEDAFLGSQMGQCYFVTLNVKTRGLRSSETPLRVRGLCFPLQLCDTQDEVSQTLAGGVTNGLGELSGGLRFLVPWWVCSWIRLSSPPLSGSSTGVVGRSCQFLAESPY